MGNTTVTFTVDSIDPTVSIDYPSSGENFNILNVNVNSTIIDTNLESCWYTNDTGVNNHTFVCGTNLTTIGWEQGNNTVYVYANDTANNWGSDNISFNVDSFNPNVTINYPTNGSSFTSANININSTIQDGNLDSCWYSNNSGVTNNTFVCANNLTGIEWEQNSLVYIYANDSYGNWNYSSVHFTWIPYSIINESWSASALETEYETFRINITSSVGYSISSAILNYNGTKYSASSNLIAGANYSIYKSIYTPPSSRSSFGNEIRYFNWTINITEESTGATSSYLTDTQNQSVAELFFEFCGNNAKETLLNLTLNNQYNSLPINASTNATTIRAFFNYGLTENSIFKNYSMLNLSVDYSSFAYCTNTSSQDLFVNMNTEYSAVGFSPASYSISSSNMSTTDPTLLNLFLIRDSDSLEFFIIVQEDLYPITNALINIQKFFLGEGVYKSVEIKETDADGKFTSYLELDQDYRFSIVKDGTLLGVVEKKSICESAPCTLTLSITSASQEALSGLTSIYAENIAYNLSYNPLTEFVTFQFTDITGTADYFRMYVYQGFGNESSKLIYDKLLYTSSGSILWNSSGYSKGDFRVETYISRSPELFIDFITFFKNIGVELGVIGLFTAFLLVLTIIFGLSFKPAMFIMAVPLSLSLFKIVGLVSLSVTSITIIYILGGIALVFLSK